LIQLFRHFSVMVSRYNRLTMKIITNHVRGCRKGPEAYFTGTVWIDEVITTPAPARVSAAFVSFAPGARTAWHTHPVGQSLHVVSGVGRVQLKGHTMHEIHPGDSVWIEAGEEHWHGAAPDRTMTHLAIQESDDSGAFVVWLKHVTDEEYLG
jgi:quercetin dioxygenase-like cupin family protein